MVLSFGVMRVCRLQYLHNVFFAQKREVRGRNLLMVDGAMLIVLFGILKYSSGMT
tara:strand:+ start:1472 stop:1636 length:165 start_codon:yes stop_codon:yes gene_type:complete